MKPFVQQLAAQATDKGNQPVVINAACFADSGDIRGAQPGSTNIGTATASVQAIALYNTMQKDPSERTK